MIENIIKLSKKELSNICAIVNSTEYVTLHTFELVGRQTGIGMAKDLVIKESDKKKVVYDVTEYDEGKLLE